MVYCEERSCVGKRCCSSGSMAQTTKSEVQAQLAMILKLKAMLTDHTSNENPGSPEPFLDLSALKKEDICDETGENMECEEELVSKPEIKQEIKDELDDEEFVFEQEIKEEEFDSLTCGHVLRECFVDLGSRKVDESLLMRTNLDSLHDSKGCERSRQNEVPKSRNRRHNQENGNRNSGTIARPRKQRESRSGRNCVYCEFRCQKLYEMIGHINNTHGRKFYVCETCKFETNQQGDYKRHLMAHAGKKPFPCPVCGERFSRRFTLEARHMPLHSVKRKVIQCKFCSYETSRKDHLRSHTIRVHGVLPEAEKSDSCPICSYKSSSRPTLDRHIANHSELKIYACDLCSYTTRLSVDLNRHKVCHLDIPQKGSSKPSNRFYQCYACSFGTHRRVGMIEHLWRHSGYKPFSCSKCIYRSSCRQDVYRHIRHQHSSTCVRACVLKKK